MVVPLILSTAMLVVIKFVWEKPDCLLWQRHRLDNKWSQAWLATELMFRKYASIISRWKMLAEIWKRLRWQEAKQCFSTNGHNLAKFMSKSNFIEYLQPKKEFNWPSCALMVCFPNQIINELKRLCNTIGPLSLSKRKH